MLDPHRSNMESTIIWTKHRPDGPPDTRASRGSAPLPQGLIGSSCTNCGTCGSLTGVLITSTADQNDPNVLCTACGFWRD